MAQEHNVSRPTIIEGIKFLEDWNIISVIKTRTKKGTWRNNAYILYDKTEWKQFPHQVNMVDLVDPQPSQRGLLHQVNVVDSKDPHIKEPHISIPPKGGIEKAKTPSKRSPELDKIISALKEVHGDIEESQRWQRIMAQRIFIKAKNDIDRAVAVVKQSPYNSLTLTYRNFYYLEKKDKETPNLKFNSAK